MLIAQISDSKEEASFPGIANELVTRRPARFVSCWSWNWPTASWDAPGQKLCLSGSFPEKSSLTSVRSLFLKQLIS
jgi:hypothetical protein